MPIMEFLGWLATATVGAQTLPLADAINNYNNHFAMEVDRGSSCFTRVSGFEGVYGGPHEFDLDPLCNYRLESYEVEDTVKKWRLIRSD